MRTNKSREMAVLGLLVGFGVVVTGFCGDCPNPNRKTPARNDSGGIILTASWYSRASLVREKTWKGGKERRMANGSRFSDTGYTCAARVFPLGARIRVVNLADNKEVTVIVTDRIGKRFAKTRIDLTPAAFKTLAPLNKGIIPVRVEAIK